MPLLAAWSQSTHRRSSGVAPPVVRTWGVWSRHFTRCACAGECGSARAARPRRVSICSITAESGTPKFIFNSTLHFGHCSSSESKRRLNWGPQFRSVTSCIAAKPRRPNMVPAGRGVCGDGEVRCPEADRGQRRLMVESKQCGFLFARCSPQTQFGRMVPPKPELCGNLEQQVVVGRVRFPTTVS